MIEDEKIGLKVAENSDEAMWHTQIKAIEMDIENEEKRLIINKAFLEKAKEELKKIQEKLKQKDL